MCVCMCVYWAVQTACLPCTLNTRFRDALITITLRRRVHVRMDIILRE